jgi:hypothetical protein
MNNPTPLENGQQALAETLAKQQAAVERNQARAAQALAPGAPLGAAPPELTLRVALDDDLIAAFNCGLRTEALLIQILRLLQARPTGTASGSA